MRPSQRRALGALLAVLVLSIFYAGTYAVLRLNGYFIRGVSADAGDLMYALSADWESGGAAYHDGRSAMWRDESPSHLPLHTLRFFTPMIRIESALRMRSPGSPEEPACGGGRTQRGSYPRLQPNAFKDWWPSFRWAPRHQ
jgi:hypothetical protein